MWRCTFADEFTGSNLHRQKWWAITTARQGYHVGPECFMDDPENIEISNGSLKLRIVQEQSWFNCAEGSRDQYTTRWTSGSLTTLGYFAQAYGRFEVRSRLPGVRVPGMGTTFWLWPHDASRYGPWPFSGEVDWLEWYSAVPDENIPFIHYVGSRPNQNGGTTAHCPISDPTAWHTYTLEWTPAEMTILIDGQHCHTDRWAPLLPWIHPQPFDQPFSIALTTALTKHFDPATTGPFPAATEIDYVCVWQMG
jgi:beta-glucanase (GH16 family)